jgi:DNA-binding GntR family transcriptional regulator
MPVAREPQTLHRGLRRQTIVESLLADVLQGRVRAGEHLVTQDLAERFGVSHTPIREALIALAGIGIVDLPPNRGAIVRRVSSREACEVMQVRRTLECLATRLACGRIALNELHELSAGLRDLIGDSERCVLPPTRGNGRIKPEVVLERARAIDSRLHDLIAESCGNVFLAKELGRMKALFRAFRDVAWEEYGARNDYRRLAEESREHLAIVTALLAGDARGAARAMSVHIRSGSRYWSRLYVGDNHNGAAAETNGSAATLNHSPRKKPLVRNPKGNP